MGQRSAVGQKPSKGADMDAILAARAQMGVSLAFHIIFAAIGMAMPLFTLIAEGLWLKTGQSHYRALARKWAKVTGLLFAVGAVSGTALSFELGLLWPKFMAFAGPMIGPAFALEGYAFFIEAIFLGLYLYGWERLTPRAHWWTGVPVAVSGILSGVLVTSANAWMQNPVGFRLVEGRAEAVSPMRALFNPAWAAMAIHATLASYVAVAFALAGIYAWQIRRGQTDDYHRTGLRIAMIVAVVGAVLQPLSGDLSAKYVAQHQPVKLAAMESLFHTRAGAPALIGGWPDEAAHVVRYGIEVPNGLSFLATGDPHAVVHGLDEVPRDRWPNVGLTHLAFQIMVVIGTGLLGLACAYWLLAWRRPDWLRRGWALWTLEVCGGLGFVALEAGWCVTEIGRQPWIINGVMRTADAATPAPGTPILFVAFTGLYIGLASVVVVLLLRLARTEAPAAPDREVPHAAD
jgi:cytochrome d ubiquinol oxidase subunit I